MIRATQSRFNIPYDCVQPLEDWHILRLPAPHDFGDVLAARLRSGPSGVTPSLLPDR